MKRKASCKLLVAVLIAGMLTGCGSQPDSGSSKGDVGSQNAENSPESKVESGGAAEEADGEEATDLSGLTFGPYGWQRTLTIANHTINGLMGWSLPGLSILAQRNCLRG